MNRKNDEHHLPPEPPQRALDEALALWADDARRVGAHADAGTTERAVFARLAADPLGRGYLRQRVSFGYVAAALVLLAVGLAGAWHSGPAPRAPRDFDLAADGAPDLEQGSLAVLRLVELEHLAVGR